MNDILLSAYGQTSRRPAPVNALMASLAANFREDVDINLGVGYVNENTIPRQQILEGVEAVLRRPDRHPFALNYGAPRGSQNLIESLRRFHCEMGEDGLTEELLDRREIIVGPNGATSLLESIALVLEPGIVLTSDPMYYIYCHFLERQGFEVVTVPEDEDGMRIDLLEEKIRALGERRQAIRFVYAVSVGNPTSSILSNGRRRDLVRLVTELSAELGRKVPLVFDRAYEQLIHDSQVEPPESALVHDEAELVYEIGTLAKILAPGLRIGYLIGSGGPFCDALVQRTSDAGFSAAMINQEVASYLLDHFVEEQIARVNQGYREKARQMKGWIEAELGEAVEDCRGGRAGFYFYLTLDGIETCEGSPFFSFLTRTTGLGEVDGPADDRKPCIIYIPGAFCVHPRGDMVEAGRRQMRLSYGFEEPERIHRALGFMRQAAAFARG